MRPKLLLAAVALLALAGCGRALQSGEATDEPPFHFVSDTARIRLLIFGAGYCSTCKTKFPELQQQLDAMPATLRSDLRLELWVTAGDPPSVRPTPGLADAYRALVHIRGLTYADGWPWRTFRKYIGNTLEVPAAVVVDENGTVLSKFVAGDTTFVPSEIAASTRTAIEKLP